MGKKKQIEEVVDFEPTGGHCWFGRHKYRRVPGQSVWNARLVAVRCERCGKQTTKVQGYNWSKRK